MLVSPRDSNFHVIWRWVVNLYVLLTLYWEKIPQILGPGIRISPFYRTKHNTYFTGRWEESQLPKRSVRLLILEHCMMRHFQKNSIVACNTPLLQTFRLTPQPRGCVNLTNLFVLGYICTVYSRTTVPVCNKGCKVFVFTRNWRSTTLHIVVRKVN